MGSYEVKAHCKSFKCKCTVFTSKKNKGKGLISYELKTVIAWNEIKYSIPLIL